MLLQRKNFHGTEIKQERAPNSSATLTVKTVNDVNTLHCFTQHIHLRQWAKFRVTQEET